MGRAGEGFLYDTLFLKNFSKRHCIIKNKIIKFVDYKNPETALPITKIRS